MGVAIFNLLIGIATIIAAFSGYVFPGTSGPWLLAILGAAITALGVYQMVKLKAGR